MKADSQHSLIAFVFLLNLALFSQAQTGKNINDSLLLESDTLYIQQMKQWIAIDLSFNNTYKTFEVQTPNTDILLYPNAPNQLRVKLSYEMLSLGFQFAPSFLPGNGDEDLKGETISFELGGRIILKHWFTEFSYSNVKGHYLRNTVDHISWNIGDPYIQFPDLIYKGVSSSSAYISNSNYSLRSLLTHTERQLKSAGSFIPNLNIDYFTIDDASNNDQTQKSNNWEINAGPGYAYTFVLNQKVFIATAANLNAGYLRTKLTTRQFDTKYITYQNNFVSRWQGKMAIGYNATRLYGGIYSTCSGTYYTQESTTASNTENRIFYHIYFGVRLAAPKALSKKTKEVKEHLPIP